MQEALVPRSDFVGLENVTHLYTGADGPLLAAGASAIEQYFLQKGRAEAGRASQRAVAAGAKTAIARLLGASPGEIAFMPSATAGINAVCELADLHSGDNVVVNDLEFPSVALPLIRAKKQGVELRLVRHRNWDITTGDVLDAVDNRTRLVAISHVSYVNGLRHDIQAVGDALRGTRTVFLVDATQSLGVMPVPAVTADFVVSSPYKWLLGVHGVGILYWNRSRFAEVEPAEIGWYSVANSFGADRYERYSLRDDAGRFETGNLAFPAIYALGASVPYLLGVGVARIASHVHALGDLLVEGLAALGLMVMTPSAGCRRGASVSFSHPRASEIGPLLAARGIHVWAGDARVRASTHLYNSERDVAAYLEALAEVLRGID